MKQYVYVVSFPICSLSLMYEADSGAQSRAVCARGIHGDTTPVVVLFWGFGMDIRSRGGLCCWSYEGTKNLCYGGVSLSNGYGGIYSYYRAETHVGGKSFPIEACAQSGALAGAATKAAQPRNHHRPSLSSFTPNLCGTLSP